MTRKAQVEAFLRVDDRGRGKGKDATDYWFRVRVNSTGALHEVPVAISRSAHATRVNGIGRNLTEDDFVAMATTRLEDRLREGFIPMREMTLDDYDAALEVTSDLLQDIAWRALRRRP